MINLRKIYIISIIMLTIQISTISTSKAQSSVFQAAYYGHSHELNYLIEEGYNVNAIDKNGWTALMYACNMSKVQTVKLLIEAGADVNFRDRDGWTPLISAEDLRVIKILVENGAKVNDKADDGWTALDYAVWEEKQDIIDYLLSVGATQLPLLGKN